MWFKNLTIFTLDQQWSLTPAALEEFLASKPLINCSALGLNSYGWIPPGNTPQLVEAIDNHLLIALGCEEKLLPASVVRDRSNDMANEWFQNHGIKPGRQLLRDFKERAISELLPRALTRKRLTMGWIDPTRQRIVVDSASAARSELLVEHLREALGSLQVASLKPSRSSRDTMTNWLRTRSLPESFSLDDACELSAVNEPGSLIRYRHYTPSMAQLREQLDQGFQVSQLALIWRDRIQLTVDSKLRIKRVKFTQMHEERRDTHQPSDDRGLEEELILMTSDFGRMIDDLIAAFNDETVHQ